MTRTAAFSNLLAELRHVEGGKNVRLSADGRTALVASESEPGVTRHVGVVGVGLLTRWRCDCPAGIHWAGQDGITPCRHAAGTARRLSRLGLVRFDYDTGMWVLTESAMAFAPVTELPPEVMADPFLGLPR